MRLLDTTTSSYSPRGSRKNLTPCSNKALQLTANPLRGLSAAELRRYAAGRVIEEK